MNLFMKEKQTDVKNKVMGTKGDGGVGGKAECLCPLSF